MAFNAIIHKHRPDLFDFSKLDPANSRYNLEHAFAIAEKELGMARLLDVDGKSNDTLSILPSVIVNVAIIALLAVMLCIGCVRRVFC